jgi:hypothetical protein
MYKMTFSANTMDNVGAGYAFDSGFGKMNVQEGETYYSPMQGIDKRKDMAKAYQANIQKAPSFGHTSGGTVTAYGLMPSFFDPAVVDRTVRQTPLVRLLPRKAVRGRAYVYNALTAKTGYTLATAGSGFKGDDAAMAETVDTWTATSTVMKFAYVVGRVTGPALASGEGFLNLLAEDIRVKTATMNEILENEIVNGAVATNALGFDGLRTAISTNTTAAGGAAITLANLRTDMNTVFEANGNVDLVVTDGSTFNTIKGLLMDFQRNVEQPSAEMRFGIPDSFMFDGALFIKDRFMPTAGSGKVILYLDLRYVFLAILQDTTFEELAKVNDSQKYMLKWYGSLIVTAEALMAERTGLA